MPRQKRSLYFSFFWLGASFLVLLLFIYPFGNALAAGGAAVMMVASLLALWHQHSPPPPQGGVFFFVRSWFVLLAVVEAGMLLYTLHGWLVDSKAHPSEKTPMMWAAFVWAVGLLGTLVAILLVDRTHRQVELESERASFSPLLGEEDVSNVL